ncbi:MAG: nuclear transport factor 2 family protein [Burkholderiales bacterium]
MSFREHMPVKADSPIDVVRLFVKHVNSHDIDGLCALMSEDHTFVNVRGGSYSGRDEMRDSWLEFWEMFPDYRMEVEDMVQEDGVVAIFGVASGTYFIHGEMSEHNRWQAPAAWKASVEDGLVREWRIYTDCESVRQIVAAAKY